MTQATIEKLVALEIGTKWEKYGKSRLYLDWHKLINLELKYYKTGNISSAKLNGEKISNTYAYKIKGGQCWIDLITGKLEFKYVMDQLHEEIEERLNIIIIGK
tara:strand:- start:281 stop:589 length:309 start_codon:yes stop_codon:yes gene_type:complete